MNGRVYDPNLGRFLSVDPVYQFPTNMQSLNPYSYVLNNPLSLTDPTGYCVGGAMCFGSLEFRSARSDSERNSVVNPDGVVDNGMDTKTSSDDPQKPTNGGDGSADGPAQVSKQSGNNPIKSDDDKMKEFVTGTLKDLWKNANDPHAQPILTEIGEIHAQMAANASSRMDNGVVKTIVDIVGTAFESLDKEHISQTMSLLTLKAGTEEGAVAPKLGSSGGPGAGKSFTQSMQENIRADSNNKCVFCGVNTIRSKTPDPNRSNIDHAIPVSRGGNNSYGNGQNTCQTCNLQKGTQTTEEYLKSIQSNPPG